jgi:hypothetical protein
MRQLRLDLREGMHLEIEIDPGTARTERSRSVMGPLVFETLHEDYREVGGIVFSFAETTWAMGQKTGRFELESVVADEEIRDRIFFP